MARSSVQTSLLVVGRALDYPEAMTNPNADVAATHRLIEAILAAPMPGVSDPMERLLALSSALRERGHPVEGATVTVTGRPEPFQSHRAYALACGDRFLAVQGQGLAMITCKAFDRHAIDELSQLWVSPKRCTGYAVHHARLDRPIPVPGGGRVSPHHRFALTWIDRAQAALDQATLSQSTAPPVTPSVLRPRM